MSEEWKKLLMDFMTAVAKCNPAYGLGTSTDAVNKEMALNAYVANLEAENARLREALRWIPVEERMPETNKPVIVFSSYGDIFFASHEQYGWITWKPGTIICWLDYELPQPPEAS
jgi:hypothetical protein